MLRVLGLAVLTLCLAAGGAQAASLSVAEKAAIDANAREWLAKTQAPSISIAVVKDGEIAYVRAYGLAAAPKRAATAATPYPMFSVSKEFTAAAILKLQEEGKLSLDDNVARFFPELTGADKITIRQILNHSAGIRDFWPQDFIPIEIAKDATPAQIMAEWAKKPLDFEPGSDRQYSNTGFVVAAAIVEKASGMPLMAYLRSRIFTPLGVTVWDEDSQPLPASAARGYTRFADSPTRPAPREGRGWMFGAGELAMTPQSLAKWDITLINRSLLSAASYDALYTPVKTSTGKGRPYSLGLDVGQRNGSVVLGHGGAGSGYLTDNRIWPKEKVAIVAFTNNDWAGPDEMVSRIAAVILPPNEAEARARKLFAGFAAGTVDRSLFTENANAYLTDKVLADQKLGLAKYGPARLFEMRDAGLRGGMLTRVWNVTCARGKVVIVERAFPGGKVEQFLISRD